MLQSDLDARVIAYKKSLAQKFTKLREDSGMTQGEMAEAIGTSQNLVYRSEKDCEISLDALLTLFFYYKLNFKVSTEWFFGEENNGYLPYEMEPKKNKRLQSQREKKQIKILQEMISKLREGGLLQDDSSDGDTE